MRVLCIDKPDMMGDVEPPPIEENEIYHPIREGSDAKWKHVTIGPWYELAEAVGWKIERKHFVPLGDEEVTQEEVEDEMYVLVEKEPLKQYV